jgi:hypothetical protein
MNDLKNPGESWGGGKGNIAEFACKFIEQCHDGVKTKINLRTGGG